MQDRQIFETHLLRNGITVYAHPMDVPYFSIHLILPVGSVHSHAGNPGGMPGIAHFMEHALFHRSEKYPEKDSFHKTMSLKGGYWNAATYPFATDVYLDAPSAIQHEAIGGLLDHLLHPIVLEEDLRTERDIVRNERDMRKYYPSNSELGQYLDTKWMHDRYYSREQVFGTDAVLDQTTPKIVQAFQSNYSASTAQVMIGGSYDLPFVLDSIGAIATHPVALTAEVEPAKWVNRAYHEKEFREAGTPTYFLGTIVPELNFYEHHALQFILRLVANDVHGPLYEWTRKEKGWTYGMSYGGSRDRDRMEGWLKIPLNTREPVEEIRREIHDRMRQAISDEVLVKSEIERREYQRLFYYQTLDDRMASAMDTLMVADRIYTEKEYKEMIGSFADTRLLLDLYKKYLAPEVSGEFLALPVIEQASEMEEH